MLLFFFFSLGANEVQQLSVARMFTMITTSSKMAGRLCVWKQMRWNGWMWKLLSLDKGSDCGEQHSLKADYDFLEWGVEGGSLWQKEEKKESEDSLRLKSTSLLTQTDLANTLPTLIFTTTRAFGSFFHSSKHANPLLNTHITHYTVSPDCYLKLAQALTLKDMHWQ